MDSKVVCRLKWMKVQSPDCEEDMTLFKAHRSVTLPQKVICWTLYLKKSSLCFYQGFLSSPTLENVKKITQKRRQLLQPGA